MCGIVAVLRRPSARPVPDGADVLADVARAVGAVGPPGAGPPELTGLEPALAEAGRHLELADRALRGLPGLQAMLADEALLESIAAGAKTVAERLLELEDHLDGGAGALLPPADLEGVNAAIVRVRDAAWSLRNDRVRAARSVADLAGGDVAVLGEVGGVAAMFALDTALASLDRLEVRGRDSAGVHVLVDGHGLDPAAVAGRDDLLFASGTAVAAGGRLSFVYKAAAEIGELGDNVSALRAAIRSDVVLRRALSGPDVRVTVLGHTRWASVGSITQANAHPVNSEEVDGHGFGDQYVTAALNGDVDNYSELSVAAGLALPAEITTDAKVIPTLVARRLAGGESLDAAFRATVATFEGSVAIGASAAADPDRLLLALRGSGQALYIGLAEDGFVVASEPYGLVEETLHYLRMDGDATGGQVVALERDGAGTLGGLRRWSYAGEEMPVGEGEVVRADITTRDIDRAGYPHFLLKEIGEAPQSFRKTLRGKIRERDGLLGAHVGEEVLPAALAARLADRSVRRILVIGQGTTAVAGQSVAQALAGTLAPLRLTITAEPATELSGFHLADDMADTIVIAISQSGTTTDTNRTVDLARARGAGVLAIVNRRNSDLVEKADGVLYTSDGRDVEMAVPSTKAFYAQVAAGFLLAAALADAANVGDRHATHLLLEGLLALPAAMEEVLATREEIAAVAQQFAPPRRYWAIVGNGPNRTAAAEIRIKLSELCYKSIACDVTEDKKHIDLAAEPLILVCAAGLTGPNADDVGKEVAIYRAHKAAPIVIASRGTSFQAALATIVVPAADPRLAFVLSAMAGHLFGYEAALAIDAQARPLREARAMVESAAEVPGVSGSEAIAAVSAGVAVPAATFLQGLRDGAYNGHLEASTAVRLAGLLRTAAGPAPLEAYEAERGAPATPGELLAELVDALTKGIDELTRPIDAIKHQAKTVTVGISRSEEGLYRGPLVAAVLASGAMRDRLTYRTLRTLAALDAAVALVSGHTRYRVEGDPPATIHVVDQGGVAAELASRTDSDPRLRGTKHRAVDERDVTVARGRSDGRTVVLVPEIKAGTVTGLTLLHVAFVDRLSPGDAREVIVGYRQRRYEALVDAVTETEPSFDESVLATVAVIDLLVEPVLELAERWRR